MTLSMIVEAIGDETAKVRVLTLRAQDNTALRAYTAGAHIDVDLGALGTRSYSLIDWPAQKTQSAECVSRYVIAVQREDDGTGGSKAMHELGLGQSITVSQPSNDFELSSSKAPALLLAGGIGVTPLISMATTLHARDAAFDFHYTGRTKGLMAFADELMTIFPRETKLHFDDEKPLDLNALMGAQSADTNVYVCGPKGMIEAARAAAIENGLAEENIHVELFSAPEVLSDDKAFEVEIHNSGDVFVIPSGRTIIEVLEECGIDLMFDCQRGDCGICQTDVIRGIPDHRDVVLSEADRASGKVMQICVSRAKSDRLVLDI